MLFGLYFFLREMRRGTVMINDLCNVCYPCSHSLLPLENCNILVEVIMCHLLCCCCCCIACWWVWLSNKSLWKVLESFSFLLVYRPILLHKDSWHQSIVYVIKFKYSSHLKENIKKKKTFDFLTKFIEACLFTCSLCYILLLILLIVVSSLLLLLLLRKYRFGSQKALTG